MQQTTGNEKLLGSGLAALATLALLLWLLDGRVLSQPNTPNALNDAAPPNAATPVTVSLPVSQRLTPTLTVTGETAAERQVTLRAQREGRVQQVHQSLGATVNHGDVLLTLDPEDLAAQHEAATAELARQKSEYEAAKRLEKQKLVGQTRLAETRAAFTRAAAAVAQLDTERRLRQITAPFSGTIDEDYVEIGDFIQVGAPLFRLVDLSQIYVSAEIAEADLHRVFVGQPAAIKLNAPQKTGPGSAYGSDSWAAKVVHIAKVPQDSTRTYRLKIAPEITADLTTSAQPLPAVGMSATVTLRSPETPAFLISPALLHLNAEGVLGVKTVTASQQVAFQPVEILKADQQGLWVSGLQAQVPIITIGQGYVRVGETVTPIRALDAPTQPTTTP